MSDPTDKTRGASGAPDSGGGFADFVVPLVRRRRMIIGLVGTVAVVAVIAALMWPKSWRSAATLLPPERRMDNPLFVPGGFEGLASGLRGFTLRHVATPSDIFVAILESRNVAEAIVERFDLMEEYEVKKLGKAVAKLHDNVEVSTTADGTIKVAAVASSAQLAADISNALVAELDRVNRTLANAEAAAIREFVESELGDAKTRLATAEDQLRAFQERYGAVEITEQARAVIAAAAEMRAQILMAEVELGVLLRSRDESHPDVQRARDYVNELELRLAEIEGTTEAVLSDAPVTGSAGSGPSVTPSDTATNGDLGLAEPPAERNIFPPLSRVPALGLKFGRLFRELKTEEAVVVLLTEQYHRARIEERRSLPTVRVLDSAVPAERRFRPRRTLIVLIATGVGLLLSVILAYTLEVADRIRKDPVRYAGFHRIADDFRKGVRH
ncbi:MAG: hypothetical protein HKN12_07590 [Gemmatimonadetes bacterium]|nr:hypothetical protein [Gemmatimonadota bacterium]